MVTDNDSPIRRRELIALLGAGSVTALAGCGGGGGDGDGGGTTPTATPSPTATPQGGVPAEYETATAIGGQQRNPDALSSKSAVEYQEQPEGDQQCSNCTFYIEDANGDGLGACAIVEGTIDPEAWCVSYAPHEAAGATTATATPAQTVEPVSVPADVACPVCGMTAANFPDWNAQALHEDGTRAFFCTSGCATTYYAVSGRFAGTDAAVSGLWVRDFDTRELIDGTDAYYALETDSDRVDDPMRLNPAAFASREAAVAYVEAVDYLAPEDIVELGAFDRNLASRYRGRFLDD
jgi:nitrous oxide reductase accessory protein NosL